MKKRGCLTWVIGFVAVCLLLVLYSFAWIPAIGFIIYYVVKKDFSGKRKRNFIISIGVFITSIIVFFWLGDLASSLTSVSYTHLGACGLIRSNAKNLTCP